jgi:two-component system nitrate/nitrite response regulator NarL
MVRVGIHSDDAVLVYGVQQVLAGTEDMRIHSVFSDAGQFLKDIPVTKCDIVLLDMCSDVNLALISDVRKACPDISIVLWGREVPPGMAYQSMAMGIRGILKRTLPSSELIRCLRKVARNDVWFDESLTAGFFRNRIVKLTRREEQLVALLARGLKNKEIAHLLSLSEGTIKVYFSRLFEKLDVKDRFELALYGLRNMSSLVPAGMFTDQQQAIPEMPIRKGRGDENVPLNEQTSA